MKNTLNPAKKSGPDCRMVNIVQLQLHARKNNTKHSYLRERGAFEAVATSDIKLLCDLTPSRFLRPLVLAQICHFVPPDTSSNAWLMHYIEAVSFGVVGVAPSNVQFPICII